MDSHASDLRAEVHDDELVDQVKNDYRQADLAPADRALMDYASKLTSTPVEMESGDVQALRDAGFTDRAIHDAVQVAAYFNYINRIADGLGVDPEPPGVAPVFNR